MEYKLEAVVLPVSDVDRSKAFYADKMGFNVDVDHQPNESFRVVQLTPPGSACSIVIGIGIGVPQVAPGTYQGLHLVVNDIETARTELAGRGVDVGEPYHFGAEGQAPGIHPERIDYGTYLAINDPDGNGWARPGSAPHRDVARLGAFARWIRALDSRTTGHSANEAGWRGGSATIRPAPRESGDGARP